MAVCARAPWKAVKLATARKTVDPASEHLLQIDRWGRTCVRVLQTKILLIAPGFQTRTDPGRRGTHACHGRILGWNIMEHRDSRRATLFDSIVDGVLRAGARQLPTEMGRPETF